MATFRAPAVFDALVVAFDATDVDTVYDGPIAALSTAPADFVIVGGTDDPDAEVSSGGSAWAGIGANARNEEGTVVCTVVAQSGSSTAKVLRDRVYNILGQFETALVADPTLATAGLSAGWLQVQSADLTQVAAPEGRYARLLVTVSYQSRI